MSLQNVAEGANSGAMLPSLDFRQLRPWSLPLSADSPFAGLSIATLMAPAATVEDSGIETSSLSVVSSFLPLARKVEAGVRLMVMGTVIRVGRTVTRGRNLR